MPTKILALVLGALLFYGCTEEKVPERFYPRNDHEAYWYSLKQANLLSTALGEDWLKAADKPFDNQIKVNLPYQEAFVIADTRPDALGYRFEAKRGQKILVDIEIIVPDTTRVFIDLFRIENDSLAEFRQVASADSSFQLGFEPRRDATYLLRLQPELLRGGDFKITIENVPTLAFPVAGKNRRAIQSFFGDPRDAGRRDHHGVDIFAKRHTPIIAPIKADVRFVGTRGLGGKVVWLRDRKTGNNLYFAHLQEQKVERYQTVNPGDTIGTVGNTGNARYTPPHLHFGIYRNGPVDPFPFIVPEVPRAEAFEPDTLLLGKRVALAKSTFLKSEMRWKSHTLDTLHTKEEVEILAVNHNYVRVKTSDGGWGFLRKRDVPYTAIQSSSSSD
ncbi:MAG: M23 family metallopeptidase [Cyclobacteriaceae bacterium]